MKDNNFDNIIKSELLNEVSELRMSEELKNRIKKSTTKKPDTLVKKIMDLLDRSIEIPVASAIAGCMVTVVILCFPVLNNSFRTYSGKSETRKYEIVDTGNFQIVFNCKKEVVGNGDSKN